MTVGFTPKAPQTSWARGAHVVLQSEVLVRLGVCPELGISPIGWARDDAGKAVKPFLGEWARDAKTLQRQKSLVTFGPVTWTLRLSRRSARPVTVVGGVGRSLRPVTKPLRLSRRSIRPVTVACDVGCPVGL